MNHENFRPWKFGAIRYIPPNAEWGWDNGILSCLRSLKDYLLRIINSLTSSIHKLYNASTHAALSLLLSARQPHSHTNLWLNTYYLLHIYLAQSQPLYNAIRVFLCKICHLLLTTGLLNAFNAHSTPCLAQVLQGVRRHQPVPCHPSLDCQSPYRSCRA